VVNWQLRKKNQVKIPHWGEKKWVCKRGTTSIRGGGGIRKKGGISVLGWKKGIGLGSTVPKRSCGALQKKRSVLGFSERGTQQSRKNVNRSSRARTPINAGGGGKQGTWEFLGAEPQKKKQPG